MPLILPLGMATAHAMVAALTLHWAVSTCQPEGPVSLWGRLSLRELLITQAVRLTRSGLGSHHSSLLRLRKEDGYMLLMVSSMARPGVTGDAHWPSGSVCVLGAFHVACPQHSHNPISAI
jgi:hypothetical protein